MKKILSIAILLYVCIIPKSVIAGVILVPSAIPSIQAAIDVASDGDFIVVRRGIYDQREGFYNIDLKGLAVIILCNSGAENCIIKCGDGNRGFIFQNNESANTIIYGFTIQDANFAGDGGAIYCTSASPTITGCIIKNNIADYGAGIYCDDLSAPTFIDCNINQNSATYQGGGIYSLSSSPIITDCLIKNNSAGKIDSAGSGGGIYCDDSSPLITGTTIKDNNAPGNYAAGQESYGGGMDCQYSSTPTIDNCIITGNWAVHGGGIDCYDFSSPTITNSTISGNSAIGGEGGAILLEGDCNGEIKNCILQENLADYAGGAISFASYSSPTIKSSTISSNTSGSYGAGINCIDSSPAVINCSIVANATYLGQGGGIFCENSSISLKNSIVWANRDFDGIDETAQIDGGTPIVTYSCIQDDNPDDISIPFDSNNIDDDPMFLQNPNNGGDRWGDDPCTPGVDEGDNDDFGDLHLHDLSPCVETGDPNYMPDPNDLDIDHQPRSVGSNTDMGSDEFVLFCDLDFTTAVDAMDLGHLIERWMNSNCNDSANDETDWCHGADLDKNGKVDFADYKIFANNWLKAMAP